MLTDFFDFGPDEINAIWLSIKVAVWCTIFVVPVATAIAYALVRYSFPGKTVFDSLIHLPLVLPPVVTGYALLLLLGRNGPVGAWLEATFGFVVAFRWTGAVIASAVMSLPLAVRAIRIAIEGVDAQYEKAAATLGAGPWRTFFRVTIPLAAPGLVAGAILAFAKSLGEFGATITFAGNIPGETQTIPSAIYNYTQVPGADWYALRLSIVAAAISFCALLASEVFVRAMRQRPLRTLT